MTECGPKIVVFVSFPALVANIVEFCLGFTRTVYSTETGMLLARTHGFPVDNGDFTRFPEFSTKNDTCFAGSSRFLIEKDFCSANLAGLAEG